MGKNEGGTAITSDPFLKEQDITYRYGNNQNNVNNAEIIIMAVFLADFFSIVIFSPRIAF